VVSAFSIKYMKVAFSAEAEPSRNTKSPLELNVYSDQLKLKFSTIRTYTIHFVDFFFDTNFNPRIISPTIWHISNLLLSAVGPVFAWNTS
jgi:hypothetical protein